MPFVLHAGSALAQVQESGRFLSLDLAMDAANEAVRVCREKGWPVSVSIVDATGKIKLQATGDFSASHTKDASFRKAYTTVAYASLFHFTKLSEWVAALKTNPFASTYATLPNIFLLPGAVAIKDGDEVIAAIGVGGAPGGDKDEMCAEAGLAKIKDRLTK
ncbi:hypothetical protein HYPDE_26473 [Hyphomicrobium denitrificans 1NES1]|uniref:Heme-binding protein n=2 Tax=Hyphomicrobium denitrificans TaxID=53399 RepID=N0BA48_9HYPH|nr:hypothetical protein HYPDE_26473 [Hyphomicrobium denitrificans 1NES1]